eukprot:7001738-Prymnesium_polylepis.2
MGRHCWASRTLQAVYPCREASSLGPSASAARGGERPRSSARAAHLPGRTPEATAHSRRRRPLGRAAPY